MKRITLSVLFGYLHLFSNTAVFFVLTPITLRYLGQSAYGLWAAFSSFMGYFGLFSLGMTTAVTKYTAEYLATDEPEALSKLVSTVLAVVALVGALIILVSLGLTPLIPRLFHATGDLASAGEIAFPIMASSVALGFIGMVFSNVIYGHHRMDVVKALGILQVVATAVFTLLLLYLGLGIVGVVLGTFAGLVILIMSAILFLRHSHYGIAIHPRLVDLKLLKVIGPYSVRSLVLGVTAQILYNTDNVVIGIILGSSLVTPYSIVYKLSYLSATISFMLLDTMFPTFTKLYTLQDKDALRSLYLKTVKITVAVLMPFVLFFAVLGQSFVNLWVGEGNFAGMGVLLVLLSLSFVHASVGTTGSLLQATGHNRGLMYSEMANAALNIIISVVLIYRIGLPGVALGTLIAHLCTTSWIGPLLAGRHAGFTVKAFLLSSVLPPLVVAIPSGTAWFVIQSLLPNDNVLYLGLKGILLVLIYAPLYLAVGTTREERQMYLRFVPLRGNGR